MTSMSSPYVTMVNNTYDSMGRVKYQTMPRQTGSATHNFYFSGFRNIEEDGGSSTIYNFDEKGRTIKIENALGYKSSTEYDGQNHVIKTTNPRLHSADYTYDGNQNLIRATNALTQSTDYIYDAQFHLTDTVDPLYNGRHIDYDSEHHPVLSKYGIRYNTNFQPIDNGISQTSASYYCKRLPADNH